MICRQRYRISNCHLHQNDTAAMPELCQHSDHRGMETLTSGLGRWGRVLKQLSPVNAADGTLCNTSKLTYIPLQLLISPAKRRSHGPLSHEPFIRQLLLSASFGKYSINKFHIILRSGGGQRIMASSLFISESFQLGVGII